MSRSSRFSKLEGEREGGDEKPSTGASLERFGAEPELTGRAEPVDPMAPAHGAERLQRFEADGTEGLGLDRDPLALLPMLQCPACGTDCGKFELHCHGCRASLRTPEAHAHNLKRLEALQAERAAEVVVDREKLEEKLLDAELRGAQARLAEHGMAKELRESYSGESTSSQHSALKWWGAIAVALLIAVFARGSGVKAIAAIVFGVLLLTRLPRGVWLKLGQKARRRDRD